MKISVWADGSLRDANIDELRANSTLGTWIDISDPTVADLTKLAETLEIPTQMLIGKLRSSYPHADSSSEYTKIFAWYLTPVSGKEFYFDRKPVLILTDGGRAITISPGETGIKQRVSEEFSTQDLASISVPTRVIYSTMQHLLETYDHLADEFESATEKLEQASPPWPRRSYAEGFIIRKEASRLLRVLRHFRMLTECLSKGNTQIPFTGEELRILDTAYDRAVDVEETVETTLETLRDLIGLHLDILSHDMNRAMRLLAAVTAIIAFPSVIGALLGMNLVDVPWPWSLWQVAAVGVSTAALMAAFLYRKGWLRSN